LINGVDKISHEKTARRSAPDFDAHREIVVGRNSKVWGHLVAEHGLTESKFLAISHRDVASFDFLATDRVWVFSYSRNERENTALLKHLEAAQVGQVVYVSSSSVRVAERTRCYEYPRVKQHAETTALENQKAKVLTIGLVYVNENELPAGLNVATSISEIASFMSAPQWVDSQARRKNLFRKIDTPFKGTVEYFFYKAYGTAIFSLGQFPCVMRPLDLVLKAFNMRWYGYVYLSNRLWTSTTL
jgi:hypothetical protein